jgi:hypothetical protein
MYVSEEGGLRQQLFPQMNVRIGLGRSTLGTCIYVDFFEESNPDLFNFASPTNELGLLCGITMDAHLWAVISPRWPSRTITR